MVTMKRVKLTVVVFLASISVRALAIPGANCRNDDNSVNANFYYYQNLFSDSVEVGGVRLNINGKSYASCADNCDPRTQDEMKLGFVMLDDGIVMIVSELAQSVAIYDADGRTLAKISCQR